MLGQKPGIERQDICLAPALGQKLEYCGTQGVLWTSALGEIDFQMRYEK